MKSAKRIAAVLALLLIAAPAIMQTPPRKAGSGEGATGEVVREANDELQVDTTPCGSSRTIVIFHQPYTREAAGSVNCGNVVKQLVQAVQG